MPSSQHNCPPITTLLASQGHTQTTSQPTLWPSVWCHMVWNDPWTNSEQLSWLHLTFCCSIMQVCHPSPPGSLARLWLYSYLSATMEISVCYFSQNCDTYYIYVVFCCHSCVAISTYQYNLIHFLPPCWTGIDLFYSMLRRFHFHVISFLK